MTSAIAIAREAGVSDNGATTKQHGHTLHVLYGYGAQNMLVWKAKIGIVPT